MREIFNAFKTHILVSILILVVSGCSNKVYEFRVTENTKKISDNELSKMSFGEFYNFMKIRDFQLDTVVTYTNANEIFNRYCNLKGSEVIPYNPENKLMRMRHMEQVLKDYDRYYDGSSYYGCKLYDTNEYLELSRISSHGFSGFIYGKKETDDTFLLKRNTINIHSFNDYIKKYRENKDTKYTTYSKPIEYSKFKEDMDTLRNRKGSYEVSYFSSYVDVGGKSVSIKDDEMDRSAFFNTGYLYRNYKECGYKCKKVNIESNGYDILQDSIRDDWTIQSKIDTPISKKIDSSCTCYGDAKYIMKK